MPMLNSNLPANEARSNFYQILEETGGNLRQFTISHRGIPTAVIMSAEEFASWQETLEILSDKKLLESVSRAIRSKKSYSSEDAAKLIGW